MGMFKKLTLNPGYLHVSKCTLLSETHAATQPHPAEDSPQALGQRPAWSLRTGLLFAVTAPWPDRGHMALHLLSLGWRSKPTGARAPTLDDTRFQCEPGDY